MNCSSLPDIAWGRGQASSGHQPALPGLRPAPLPRPKRACALCSRFSLQYVPSSPVDVPRSVLAASNRAEQRPIGSSLCDRPPGPSHASLLPELCVPRPRYILPLALLFIPLAPWAPTRPPLRQTASPTPSDKQLLHSGAAAEPGLELGPAHTAVPGVIRNLASNMSKSSFRRPRAVSACPAAEIHDGCGRKAPAGAAGAAGMLPPWHHRALKGHPL